MPELITIAVESELPAPDEVKEFHCGAKPICVANIGGIYSAMDGLCPHRGGPLGQGMVEGGKVVCPWHGWAWDPVTGATEQDARMKVAVYPVRIESGDVIAEV
jgi:nitrite reductase (NADH) small subunit